MLPHPGLFLTLLPQQLHQLIRQADNTTAGLGLRDTGRPVRQHPLRAPPGRLPASTVAAVCIDRPNPSRPDMEQPVIEINIGRLQAENPALP